MLVTTPAHLVALAKDAPHSFADVAGSYAVYWTNHFVAPLVRARAAADVDAFVQEHLHEAARHQRKIATLVASIASNAHETYLRVLNAALTELPPADALSPRGLSGPDRDDVIWSMEVLLFGGATAFIAAASAGVVVEDLVAADEDLETIVKDVGFLVRPALVLPVAAMLLDDVDAVPSRSAADRICEMLFQDACSADDLLAASGADWRLLRDLVRGPRAQRVQRYAASVLGGLTIEERSDVLSASIDSAQFFARGA